MNQKNAFLRILFISLFIIPVSLFAQKDPIKFGKIDRADLEMKVYPSDTSAVAAILCDFGHFISTRFEFVRTMRIKIFKKEGTSWGSQVFPFPTDAFVRGITYNLENGEIVESKLKPESVFDEKVIRDYHRKRVAMPNVKEGSVIDLEFTFKGLPGEWRFQNEIPVRWSELIIEPLSNYKFRKIFFGFEPLSIATESRWVAKEMPAFKEEPYMNAAENYMSKFEIELITVGFSEITTTWDAVNKILLEEPRFGRAMEGTHYLNDIADEIRKNYSSPMQRLIAAHEAVKKGIKWNERESVVASSGNLGSQFKDKIGNCADVNLILIQLLKKLDFEVYPVALSTRSNGFLSAVNPSLRKFNYVVAYVILNDKKYFLDATEKFLPAGMLPERCINLMGRIIDNNKSEWVDFVPDRDKKFINYDLKLGGDNTLDGKLSIANSGYAAFDFRKKYEKFNSKEEYIRSFESEHKGLRISDCNINNLDSIYLPLNELYDVKINNVVTTAGNMVYINPMLYEQIASNPFKSEDRKYPVDFIFPSDLTYVFKLELPQGTEVAELPKEYGVKLEDGSAYFQYQAYSLDKYVTLTYRFVRTKSIYTEEEYNQLKALYTELVKKHAEQIVIKRL